MIYVLQFSGPLGNDKHQAQRYIGFAEPGRLEARLHEHRTGQGAAITRAAVERGLTLELVATIAGDRKLERRLKNWKNSRKVVQWIRSQQMELCPRCQFTLIHTSQGLCPDCFKALDAEQETDPQ